MKAAVVFESMFGNTRAIAEAVAAGVRDSDGTAEVALLPLADATSESLRNVDLLVVGGPTHIGRMTSPRTRRMGLGAAAKPPKPGTARFELTPGAGGPGVREWLKGLPKVPSGRRAGAFDTRLPFPAAGGAARGIARALRQRGYDVRSNVRGFVVEAAQGPLRAGEAQRAKAWGATLKP